MGRNHGPGVFDNLYHVTYANKQVLAKRIHRLCARCCTQHLTHTGNYCQLFPLAPTPICPHICMCSRKDLDELFFPRTLGLIQAVAGPRIAPPFPMCNSPFHIHSRLLCHEHYLSVPSSLLGRLPTTTAQ